MPFSYNKLWKLLIDKNMTKSELTKAIGISSSTMAKMGKNENVSLEVIDKICALLECDINDILEYVSGRYSVFAKFNLAFQSKIGCISPTSGV